MKAWSAQPARRVAVVGIAALGAVSLLGGCGFETRQQAAAVVNGEVIHESDVRETYDQLKAAKLDFAENIVVTALVAAPLLKDVVGKSGSWKPDETYASVISSIPDATDTTKEFVAAVALIQSQKMTPADVAAYRARPQEGRHQRQPQVRLRRAVRRGARLLHHRSADAQLGQAGRQHRPGHRPRPAPAQ